MENQQVRLQELLGIPPEDKEKPLRRDVRSLGQLLGNVLKEQEGQQFSKSLKLFDGSPSRHGRKKPDSTRCATRLPGSATGCNKLAKAFATYSS